MIDSHLFIIDDDNPSFREQIDDFIECVRYHAIRGNVQQLRIVIKNEPNIFDVVKYNLDKRDLYPTVIDIPTEENITKALNESKHIKVLLFQNLDPQYIHLIESTVLRNTGVLMIMISDHYDHPGFDPVTPVDVMELCSKCCISRLL